MTISATTQGLRMGVATSSSRPTVPFDGQVISETDTDTLQVYKSSAWAPVSGLVYLTGATFTGATTVSMATGVFTSTYKNYMVTLNVTSGTRTAGLRVNNAGTPRTAGNYYGAKSVIGSGGAQTLTGSSGTTSLDTLATSGGTGGGSTIWVYDPLEASGYTSVGGVGAYQGIDSFGGMYNVLEAHDGLTWVFTASSTGYYKVYGLANS